MKKYSFRTNGKNLVKFQNGKKMKLRKVVSELASSIQKMKLSDKNYSQIRLELIEAYDNGGLIALGALYQGFRDKFLQLKIDGLNEKAAEFKQSLKQTNNENNKI